VGRPFGLPVPTPWQRGEQWRVGDFFAFMALADGKRAQASAGVSPIGRQPPFGDDLLIISIRLRRATSAP